MNTSSALEPPRVTLFACHVQHVQAQALYRPRVLCQPTQYARLTPIARPTSMCRWLQRRVLIACVHLVLLALALLSVLVDVTVSLTLSVNHGQLVSQGNIKR